VDLDAKPDDPIGQAAAGVFCLQAGWDVCPIIAIDAFICCPGLAGIQRRARLDLLNPVPEIYLCDLSNLRVEPMPGPIRL
jgi:hypothetical protein